VTARIGLIIRPLNRMVEPCGAAPRGCIGSRTIGEPSNERLETALGRRVLVRGNPVPGWRSAFADDGVSLPRPTSHLCAGLDLARLNSGSGLMISSHTHLLFLGVTGFTRLSAATC
jgi:hypothetical protein